MLLTKENIVNIEFTWDAESEVWVATSSELDFFTLSHGSLDVLIERVKNVTSEMAKENEKFPESMVLSYHVERVELFKPNG